jgi:hypothetical protein
MTPLKTQRGFTLLGFSQTLTHEIKQIQTSITISSSSVSELEPLMEQATREKLLFAGNTNYLVVKDQTGAIIAFCGILLYPNKAVFKSDYVLPEYRGNRLWGLMFDARKDLVSKIAGVEYIEATCTPLSLPLYLEKGCDIIEKYKTDSLTKVRMRV